MTGLNTYSLGAVLDAPTDMLVRDVKVFKVGTFRNQRGERKTYSADELQTAVRNFHDLRGNGRLPNVPMRLDHTQSVRDVCGYFSDMRFDGQFLVADLQFTDAKAYHDYSDGNGTLRSRSLEIGMYRDNDDNLYDPVVQGLAWVDIPAVEGLFRTPEQGVEIMATETNEERLAREAAEAAESETPEQRQVREAAEAAEAAEAEAGQAENETPEQRQAREAAERLRANAGTPPPVTTPPPSTHAAQREVHTFRVSGQDVSDFAAVQAHIDHLETDNGSLAKFRSDVETYGRHAFVDGLASNHLITGPQTATFRQMVDTMDESQFALFRSGFDQAAPLNIFARHDVGDGASVATDAATREQRRADLEEIVATARRRPNMTDEKIKELDSYKELQAILDKEN